MLGCARTETHFCLSMDTLPRPASSKLPVKLLTEIAKGDRTRSHPRSLASTIVLLLVLLFLVSMGWYVDTLQTEIEAELINRQRLETALAEETRRVNLLRQQVGQQEREVGDLREGFSQRRSDAALLVNAVSIREQESGELRARLAQQELDLLALRKTTAQQDHLLAILRSQGSQAFLLTGTRVPSSGGIVIVASQARRALFYAFNLPILPVGKTYQLWVMSDKPVSAAVFRTDSSNKALLLLRAVADWQTARFAVSVEPEGGRPQPSGDFYLTSVL
jgi:Anti-sigma-K factor rskA